MGSHDKRYMAMYKLRDYQQKASDKAVAYFQDKANKRNTLLVLPTGSGKSLVIADIANRLDAPTLVFQPSKEILEQNYGKLCAYGVLDCSVYSASCNSKEISRITFATIGSVRNNKELFSHFKYVIVDECHLCNPKEGMYKDFFATITCKILGLTATPYRLYSNMLGSQLRFITRTSPRVFNYLLFGVQIQTLVKMGFLAKLNYYNMTCVDVNRLEKNSTGADYTDISVRKEYKMMNFDNQLLSVVQRVLYNASMPRKGVLIFTRFVDEAQALVESLPFGVAAVVSSDTPKKDRERILSEFKEGKIKVVANVGVLTTGFDYPELDTVILARPTMSLTLYYQMVGRAIRPHETKLAGWIIDLCGNFNRFGRVEELEIKADKPDAWYVRNKQRQLTNVIL